MQNRIEYGNWEFTGTDIASINAHMATSLIMSALEANVFTAVVKSEDPFISQFVQNTPVYYYHRDKLRGVYYLQSVLRVGKNKYKLQCTSSVGLLIQRMHAGGIYNGESVETIISDICGTIPFAIKNSLRKVKLYGWLPYAKPPESSARDNLLQVLFAIGATAKTDNTGILRIEGLWDGAANNVPANKVYEDPSVSYSALVSKVLLTEHQYTEIETTESEQLFEGTAQANTVITFSQPMHSLTADGFSVLESNANYAVLSSGSGTLYGKKYVHNTRQIFATVNEDASAENVKSFPDKTLVSLVNSSSVVRRLAAYYACPETIKEDIVLTTQSAGDVIITNHPYDGDAVSACIKSLEVLAGSSVLRATAEAVVGFLPQQTAETEYYDYRELITDDGEWVVPDGVTSIAGVLIGGGVGGWSGLRGEDSVSPTSTGESGYTGYDPGFGAEGGAGGEPGAGGKVLLFNLDITPGQKFTVKIGKGGIGGVYSADGSVVGSEGGATTFGALSSAAGASSENGYQDIITGEWFAKPGTRKGIAGGKGSGANPDNPTSGYVLGPTVTDYDGNVWNPGPITSYDENVTGDTTINSVDYHAEAGKGLGGGAAVGSDGHAGSIGSVEKSSNRLYPYSGPTGHGADAVKPAKQTLRGYGGDGGHGGGGEGGTGLSVVQSGGGRAYISSTRGGPGAGSDGGDAGDGCLILYYQKPKPVQAGAVMDSAKRFILDKTGRLMVV